MKEYIATVTSKGESIVASMGTNLKTVKSEVREKCIAGSKVVIRDGEGYINCEFTLKGRTWNAGL